MKQSNLQTQEQLAYEIWQEGGCREGSAEADWLAAESRLAQRQRAASHAPTTAASPSVTGSVDDSLRESFPASDPPSTHVTDEPPVNADAKWRAAHIDRR